MEFGTQDPWLAAYLAVMGVLPSRVDILPTRRARWVFPRQLAVGLADEFRTGREAAVAPIPAFRTAYRAVINMAEAAREGLPIGSLTDGERAA